MAKKIASENIVSLYVKDRQAFNTAIKDDQKLWYEKTGQSCTHGDIIMRGLISLKSYLQNDYLINKPEPVQPISIGRLFK